MRSVRDLMETQIRDGVVDWIGIRSSRRLALIAAGRVAVTVDGLEGDHARAGKRAVTLIQAEHLPVISALCDVEATPGRLRRNLVVSGINLAALRKRDVAVGSAVLHIWGPCPPCSRMEEELGPGGYQAVRHHGGWYAEVVTPGEMALGDLVRPA
ncbi:MAG: MOSC domain-containing protein [Pseudomonadota bacterium]